MHYLLQVDGGAASAQVQALGKGGGARVVDDLQESLQRRQQRIQGRARLRGILDTNQTRPLAQK